MALLIHFIAASEPLYNCTAVGYCPPLKYTTCNSNLQFQYTIYKHSPDPLIVGKPYTLIKYGINKGPTTLYHLYEYVYVYQELQDETYQFFFTNSFDYADFFPDQFPIKPGQIVNFTDTHPSASSPAKSSKSFEYYYPTSNTTDLIGCFVVYFESVDT